MVTNVVSFGCAPTATILLNNSIDFLASLFIATPDMIAFHAPPSFLSMPSKTDNAASMQPHFAYMSTMAVAKIALDPRLYFCFA
ncbi:hypothetical protein Scep_008416 [Stephania cephalantha]|uniref:Uncharacterized protein n=1 Tax=Stephania cephalantha TaxID=152367 RepID=A0AAP0KDL9_9MAGN